MPGGVIATDCKVNEDPMFVDYNSWDYHPAPGSPLIDAGISIPGITTDLDGKTRGAKPDIGCYEQ